MSTTRERRKPAFIPTEDEDFPVDPNIPLMTEVVSEAGLHDLMSGAKTARINMIVIVIFTIAVMSSCACLLMYRVPIGDEYKTAHSYYAAWPAVFGSLALMTACFGTLRNIPSGSTLAALVVMGIHALFLLYLVGVSIYDAVTCDAPTKFYCYNVITGNIIWQWWWWAISVWVQTVLTIVYLIVHSSMKTKIQKGRVKGMPFISRRIGIHDPFKSSKITGLG